MSDKKNDATNKTELKEVVEEKTSRVKTFFKEKKKTLITVGVTAATTAGAVLFLKRERPDDYEDHYEDEFEEENE